MYRWKKCLIWFRSKVYSGSIVGQPQNIICNYEEKAQTKLLMPILFGKKYHDSKKYKERYLFWLNQLNWL